jgi:hypothetical protein
LHPLSGRLADRRLLVAGDRCARQVHKQIILIADFDA